MQKIVITGYNHEGEELVTEDELYSALDMVGLSNLDIQITELENGDPDD